MKLCHMTCHKVGIITYIPHLGGTAPLKFGRAKNVQNSAQFITTVKFDCKYLKNRSIYQKTNFIENNFCCVEQKKFGELLCSNKKVMDADVDPPKIDCARDSGQLCPIFLNGLFCYNFFQREVKNWLKMQ